MEADDADDDDVVYAVDRIGPVLQHLVAAAMMFCTACIWLWSIILRWMGESSFLEPFDNRN